MENTVRQRIKDFLDKVGVSLNAISKGTNYPQSNLNKQINGDTLISSSTILVLLDYFPNLSAEWLLRGTGSMFLSEDRNVEKSHSVKYDAEVEIGEDGYLKIKIKK